MNSICITKKTNKEEKNVKNNIYMNAYIHTNNKCSKSNLKRVLFVRVVNKQ